MQLINGNRAMIGDPIDRNMETISETDAPRAQSHQFHSGLYRRAYPMCLPGQGPDQSDFRR